MSKRGSKSNLRYQNVVGKLEDVFNALNNIPHLHTYKKEQIPREYFYTWNRRIQPIVIEAEEGYEIVQSLSSRTLGNRCTIVLHKSYLKTRGVASRCLQWTTLNFWLVLQEAV